MVALLVSHGQKVLYIPGRTVHHASGSYRGDGKTDAKDAFVIADQARMRRDLQPVRSGSEIAVDLRILTSRRLDLAADRTRAINRLRAQLLEYFPALERAFDYKTSKAALAHWESVVPPLRNAAVVDPATLRRVLARLARGASRVWKRAVVERDRCWGAGASDAVDVGGAGVVPGEGG